MNWEQSNEAIRSLTLLINELCEHKPKSTAPKNEADAWESKMNPLRAKAIELHYIRIQLNIQYQKEQNERT